MFSRKEVGSMSQKGKSFSEVSKKAVQMHSIWKIDEVAFFE